jgi:hypothetical protein
MEQMEKEGTPSYSSAFRHICGVRRDAATESADLEIVRLFSPPYHHRAVRLSLLIASPHAFRLLNRILQKFDGRHHFSVRTLFIAFGLQF